MDILTYFFLCFLWRKFFERHLTSMKGEDRIVLDFYRIKPPRWLLIFALGKLLDLRIPVLFHAFSSMKPGGGPLLTILDVMSFLWHWWPHLELLLCNIWWLVARALTHAYGDSLSIRAFSEDASGSEDPPHVLLHFAPKKREWYGNPAWRSPRWPRRYSQELYICIRRSTCESRGSTCANASHIAYIFTYSIHICTLSLSSHFLFFYTVYKYTQNLWCALSRIKNCDEFPHVPLEW